MERTPIRRGKFLARFDKPGLILLLAHDMKYDRHIGVILATDLGALAIIIALTLGFEPAFVHPARDSVDADAKGGDRE
jgi:hypothetical protein